ncbi:CYFA0S31e00540g1_1 [Cyberlindnera fabianii]|uniref:CYFA0S31e00540g1_1 n=1 Tax=Cyberlindnera fabianii TaxID=36022 RepID=A0A061BBK4_CYBFA|nr:Thymocyte nuclear protein 1 [Cyberlindnera fabianii]CDR47338.1 CYFA0S31e00540g1_1 [Cyberlindnera fabianii]
MPPRVQKKPVTKTKTTTKTDDLVSKIDVSSLQKPEPKKPAQFPVDPKNNNVRYWLIKSEPYTRIDPRSGKDVKFPLSALKEVEFEPWDGVRNHEAKNNMLNMRKGDFLLFYHSNAPIPGLVGIAEVANEAHPDLLQFDKSSHYYDPKSSVESPRWWCVDVKFKRRLRAKIPLAELQGNAKLSEMSLVKRGRLSVSPVRKEEYYTILEMESAKPVTDDIDCDLDHKFIDWS